MMGSSLFEVDGWNCHRAGGRRDGGRCGSGQGSGE